MDDPSVAYDEEDTEQQAQQHGDEDSQRRWWWLVAAVILLLLLMFAVSTIIDQTVSNGPQEAQFVARNAECLSCHQDMMPNFSKASIHAPFAQRECTVCHTPHGARVQVSTTQRRALFSTRWRTLLEWLPLRWLLSWSGSGDGPPVRAVLNSSVSQTGSADASMTTIDAKGGTSELVASGNELCWTCHGDLAPKLGEAYQHLPFQAGRCTECHDPHASDNKPLLKASSRDLCFTCHPMGLELNKAQSHAPAKQGNCTDCHDPHASQYRGILVARQRDLCFRCHPTVAVLSDKAVQHQPYLDDNCTGCHAPHGSDASPLLIAEQPKLCYSCHPGIASDFSKSSRHPVGLELTCADCHDPHAADYRGLVTAQDNAFCYQCHRRMESSFASSKHDTRLCIRCHTPHGSSYAPMLVKANPDLCLECHPGLEGTNQHPVRSTFFDTHSGKGLTCTSTCHDPHGTQFGKMLRNYESELDGQCLQCHNGVGKDF